MTTDYKTPRTQLKSLEESSRSTLARAQLAQAVLESCPDGTLAIDPAGKIVFANGNIVELFGYGRRELIGKDITELLPPDKREAHIMNVNSFFARPHRRPMGTGLNVTGLTKNGLSINLSVALSYIETETGILATAFIRERTVPPTV